MKNLEVCGGQQLGHVAEEAVKLAGSSSEPVSFEFNGIKSLVFPGMSVDDVWKNHFDAVKARRDAYRAADPAYAEARLVLRGLSFDVKNALRSLLSDDGE